MRHKLDPHPIPKDETPLYVNEPWLLDKYLLEFPPHVEPEEYDDNVRIYIPMDLNKNAILRRLRMLIAFYKEADEDNELDFSVDVGQIISQIEIYDQVWHARHMSEAIGEHSAEAVGLVREFVAMLEEIPDGCSEMFPFDTIDELKREYLGEEYLNENDLY